MAKGSKKASARGPNTSSRRIASPAKAKESKNAGARAREKSARAPTHDEILRRAYEIYLARGTMPGRALDDWLEAERQLRGAL